MDILSDKSMRMIYPGYDKHHIMRKGMDGGHKCEHPINIAYLPNYIHMMLHSSPEQFKREYGQDLYDYLLDTDNNIRHLYNSGYLGD